MNDERRINQWHLDKRVPLAVIGTLLIQTVFVVLFLAGLRFDLTNTMDRMNRLETDSRLDRVSISENRINAAVTTSSLRDIKESLTRIESEVVQGRRDRELLLENDDRLMKGKVDK